MMPTNNLVEQLINEFNGDKTYFDNELIAVTFAITNLEKLCEAYHQAKCAESEPICYAPKEYLYNIKEELYVLASKTQEGIYDTPLFNSPQPFDAEAKLKEIARLN